MYVHIQKKQRCTLSKHVFKSLFNRIWIVQLVVFVLAMLFLQMNSVEDFSAVLPAETETFQHNHITGNKTLSLIVYFGFYNPYTQRGQKNSISDEEKIALVYSRYANPDAKIVLMLDDPSRANDTRALLNDLRIEVYAFATEDPKAQMFEKVYKHASVNNLLYEKMCFKRFIFLENLVERVEVDSNAVVTDVIMPDSDVIFFTNDALPSLENGIDAARPAAAGSFLTRFTRQGLTEFANFIIEFYERNYTMVYKDLVEYGNGPRVKRITIKKWLPGYNDAKMERVYQFSDMHLNNVWFDRTDLRTKTLFGKGSYKTSTVEDNALYNFNSMDPAWSCCDYPSGVLFNLNWQNVSLDSKSVQYSVSLPNRTGHSLHGLHFQGGHAKKAICPGLCPFLSTFYRMQIRCCAEPVPNT